MRVLTAIVVLLGVVSIAPAEVFLNVYRCDGVTRLAPGDPNRPNVYPDIMVGTRLVFVLTSDVGEYWTGALRLSWDDWQRATLAGRGYDPDSLGGYKGSILPAAGERATVLFLDRPEGVGLDFITANRPSAGDWFIADYYAENPGPCEVGLFHFLVDDPLSLNVPVAVHTFNHVPSCDFNGDTIVNFMDLAMLAWYWDTPVAPPADGAPSFDLNADMHIGIADLAVLSGHWLERTDCNDLRVEPQ